MHHLKAAKPATARYGEPAPEEKRLGGSLVLQLMPTETQTDKQIRLLTQREARNA